MVKKIKILIICMGPGETSQGVAFGKYASSQGCAVDYIFLLEENRHFLAGSSSKLEITNDSNYIKSKIDKKDYDCVVLCNSKIFNKDKIFQSIPPSNKPFACSIDSNWLFNAPEVFPFVKWLDQIYINIPEAVYNFGLKKNGGDYIIPQEVKEKITPVGLIPSYQPISQKEKLNIRQKLGIAEDQKFIFSYIGSGITLRNELFLHYIEIFDLLWHEQKDKFKVVFLSGDEPKKPWIILIGGKASADEFSKMLSSSDLVFQHQGFGTLEQAISSHIPVIANVKHLAHTKAEIHSWVWEVKPFEKAGLCKMHLYSDSVIKVNKSLQQLLFTKDREIMIDNQVKHYSQGEKIMLNKILSTLKNKK